MAKEATFVLERAPFTTKEGKEMYGYFVWRKTRAVMNCSI